MTKYTLSEKTVKAHLGPAYRPLAYKLDEDYIERKAFKGIRRIYRSDLLDGTLACEATDKESLTVEQPEQPADDHIGEVTEMVTEPKHIPVSNEVTEQTIVQVYHNTRWVKTDMEDKVFVGARGFNFRRGQKIRVKNKTICIR